MKKLLLLIILLVPTILLAEQDYKLVKEHIEEDRLMNYADNGQSYIVGTRNYVLKIDKITGEVSKTDLLAKSETAWGNYDLNNHKFTETEATNYFFLYYDYDTDEYKIKLTDLKFNVIKTSTIYDFSTTRPSIIPENFFMVDDYLYLTFSHLDDVYVFDNEFNYLKKIELPTNQEYYFDLEKGYYIPTDINNNTVYYIDSNQELKTKELDYRVFINNNKLIKYYYNNPENSMMIDLPEIDYFELSTCLINVNNIYYITYTTTNGKNIIASYDENLNLIKEKDITNYEGISNKEGVLLVNNGKVFYQSSYKPTGYRIKLYGLLFEVGEDLSLKESTEVKTINFRIHAGSVNETYLAFPDTKGIAIYEKIYKSIESSYYNVDLADMEKIDGKYYSLFTLTTREEGYDYQTKFKNYLYLYIYDEEGNFINKKEIKKADPGNSSRGYNATIIHIKDKLYITNIYDKDKMYVTDLNANEVTEIPSILNENYNIIVTVNNNSTILAAGGTLTMLPIVSTPRSSLNIASSNDNTTYIALIKIPVDIKTKSDNGKVTIPENSYYGETVELSIEPNKGFKVKKITIKDEHGNIIEVKDNKFIMPNSNITIDVEYEEIKNPIEEIIENPYTKDNIVIVSITAIISLLLIIYYKNKKAYLK